MTATANEVDGIDLRSIYQPEIKPILEEHPLRIEFLPWHKPRKHYIRIEQWSVQIRNLIKQLGYGQGDVIAYLGMPGPDLLDIRTLHGVCQRAKVRLKYVGFDSALHIPPGQYELDLSQHELFDLEFIDGASRVVRDRVEQIAIRDSMAHQTSSKYAPYDVINFDLTDCLAARSNGKNRGSYFDALRELFELQIRGRTKPWLLFLTTRTTREQIEPLTKRKLIKCIQDNARKHEQFRERLHNAFGLRENQLNAELDGTQPLEHSLLAKIFCLAIGKWMLEVMMSGQPHLKTTLLKSYSYSVAGPTADMLSLAFLLEPVIQPRTDPTGLSRSILTPTAVREPSEAEQALNLLAEILRIVDVDDLLLKDADLKHKMIEKGAKILASARYNVNAYRAWAQQS